MKKVIIDEKQTTMVQNIIESAMYNVGYLARFLPGYTERVLDEVKFYKEIEVEPEVTFSAVKDGFGKVESDIKKTNKILENMQESIKDALTDIRHMIAFESERTTKLEGVLKNLSEQQLKLTQFITRK